jgi:hypothetical protein
MEIEWAGQGTRNQNAVSVDPSRLINLYREPVHEGGSSRYILRSVPRQTFVCDLGGEVREMIWFNGGVHAIADGKLWTITDLGVPTERATVANAFNTSMAGLLPGSVAICSNGAYRVWDGSSLLSPTGGAFSDVGSVGVLGNRVVMTQSEGRLIQWSAPGDATSLDGLWFASTEAGDDLNLRGIVSNDYWWIFKRRSVEIWTETGSTDPTTAFTRVAVKGVGLKSYRSVCKCRDMLFWVGNDNVCYIGANTDFRPISTRQIELLLRNKDPLSALYYEHDGHKFVCLRFADELTWVYDISTNEWHERGEYYLDDFTPENAPWQAASAVQKSDDKWWVGKVDGDVVAMGESDLDLGVPLHREAISRILRNGNKLFTVDEFELFGSWSASYDEPNFALIAFSKNDGATFDKIYGRQLTYLNDGTLGKNHRVIIRKIGAFRSMCVKLEITTERHKPIYSSAAVKIR